MKKIYHDLAGNEITEKQYKNIQTNKKLVPVLLAVVVVVIVILINIPSNEKVNNVDTQIEKLENNESSINLSTATLKQNLWFTCKDKYRGGSKVFNTKVFVDNSLLINGVYYPQTGHNTWANKDMKFRINALYDNTELIIDNFDEKKSVYCNFEYND